MLALCGPTAQQMTPGMQQYPGMHMMMMNPGMQQMMNPGMQQMNPCMQQMHPGMQQMVPPMMPPMTMQPGPMLAPGPRTPRRGMPESSVQVKPYPR